MKTNLETMYRQALSIVHPTVALLALYGDAKVPGRLECGNPFARIVDAVKRATEAAQTDNIDTVAMFSSRIRNIARQYGGIKKINALFGCDANDYHPTYDIKPDSLCSFATIDGYWETCYYITSMLWLDLESGNFTPNDLDDIFAILELVNEAAKAWDIANNDNDEAPTVNSDGARLMEKTYAKLSIIFESVKRNGATATVRALPFILTPAAPAQSAPANDIPW